MFKNGNAKTVLKDNRVQALRVRAASDQADPLVLREINLKLMVEVAGVVKNPTSFVGEGNVAATKADVEFAYPIGDCSFPIINRGHTLKFNNGGNPCAISGAISGTGSVEIHAGGPNAPLTLSGKSANTFSGTWAIKSGRAILAKQPGVDALAGTIVVDGGSDN